MSRQPGILTPGLCIVADNISAHEAHELGHNHPHVQSIKARQKSFLTNALDEVDTLKNSDFSVICDGKYYFSRVDELLDTLGLFAARGYLPDAITYAPCVDAHVMLELVKMMLDNVGVMRPHTIVLTGLLPEQVAFDADQRRDAIMARSELAHTLLQAGARLALYASALDLTANSESIPPGIITIGAGIRTVSDDRYVSLKDALGGNIDIPLLGTVMGDTPQQRRDYLDQVDKVATLGG